MIAFPANLPPWTLQNGNRGITVEIVRKALKLMGHQELQVVRLYNGQTDLILIDKNTFLYFRQITAMTNTSMPIAYHQISGLTEESPAFVVFRDKALRNDFNAGLWRLKNNGDYHNIFYNYTR